MANIIEYLLGFDPAEIYEHPTEVKAVELDQILRGLESHIDTIQSIIDAIQDVRDKMEQK